MKNIIIISVVSLFCFGVISQNCNADINVGLTVGDEGIKEFHLSIGSHFGVQEKSVEKIRKRSIPDEELVIVFFYAKHAHVEPMKVVDLRLEGKSWMEISILLKLSTDMFYVQFEKDPDPPYGKAYGHYKNKPKKSWSKITLTDYDIVNIINLKFLATRYSCTPEEVVKLRKQSKSFISINSNLKKTKEQKKFANKTSNKKQSGKKEKNKKGNSNK